MSGSYEWRYTVTFAGCGSTAFGYGHEKWEAKLRAMQAIEAVYGNLDGRLAAGSRGEWWDILRGKLVPDDRGPCSVDPSWGETT